MDPTEGIANMAAYERWFLVEVQLYFFNLKFYRPPRNEHCSKDQGEVTEVYETSESSPKIVPSASSRKKKLSFVLDSDSEEDYTADAG